MVVGLFLFPNSTQLLHVSTAGARGDQGLRLHVVKAALCAEKHLEMLSVGRQPEYQLGHVRFM